MLALIDSGIFLNSSTEKIFIQTNSMSGESGRNDELENSIARVTRDLKDARTNFFKTFEKPEK